MRPQNLLETTTVTLGEVFGAGKIYVVPPFQRDYSWESENCEDLWEDIRILTTTDNAATQHYMGAIVLQGEEENRFKIIDGQQRLATLSLLALAVLRRLEELISQPIDAEANKERSVLLRNQFIGAKDPSSLRYSSKLFLNENDDDFYQQYLVQMKAPRHPNRLKGSHKRLWNSYQYFVNRVDKHFSGVTDGSILADFLNKLVARRLLFIQIKVQDELSAYTVFETLNARGLELTSTDLLKNFLFAKTSAGAADLEHLKRQWRGIVERVSMSAFPDFLFHHLNSEDKEVRQQRLFHHIKRKVDSKEKAFQLLDELEESAEWYAALDDHNDEFWKTYHGCSRFVRELKLFHVTQYKPLILAARQHFQSDPDQLKQLLRLCAVVSFRYNVIGQRNTGDLQRAYNDAAIKLRKGEYKTTRDVKNGLEGIYLSDEELRDTFSSRAIDSRNKRKLVAYILCTLENHLSGAELDHEATEATIEHILPENPNHGWDGFSEEDRERLTFRIGNYTLLEPHLNREAANKDYKTKQVIYARSKYQITKQIAFEDWTDESIATRQRILAKLAATAWRLDY